MITKITAENELEFFAAGFKAITDAFAASSTLPNILVNDLVSYYGNLEYIKQLPTESGEQGKFLLVPFDEPFFEINANARTITVPDAFKKNGVAVQGDHNAELLVFKVDRYFDYQDLLKTDISINWNFVPYGSRTATLEGHDKAFAKTLYYDTDYVIFGFIITNDMTPSRGVINFSVDFFTEVNNVIDYSLNTIITSVNVNEGLTLSDPSIVKPVNQNFIGRLGNSAYTPSTASPIAQPVWESGEVDEHNNMLGLPASESFAYIANSDDEEAELLLTTQAYTPNATIKYKWSAAPAQNSEGLVVEEVLPAEVTNVNRPTSANDYFETKDTQADDISVYYKKNSDTGAIDVANPVSGAAAQELMDQGEILYELGSSYVAKMAGVYTVEAYGYRETMTAVEANSEEDIPASDSDLQVTAAKLVAAPNDVNKEKSQANQNAIMVSQRGNNIFVVGDLGTLNSFASTNAAQGEGKWVGLDLGVNVDSITELTWNGSPLTAADVAESASVGLAENHIIFWVKAENLPRTIRIGKDAEEITIKVSFTVGQIITASSNTVQSNSCVIPVAAKPVISSFTVSSSLDPDSYVVEDESLGYIYIDSNTPPSVEAVLSSSTEEPLGPVAIEMISENADEEELSLNIDKINANIENGSYVFAKLPEDGKVVVSSDATEEGRYQIRAINHRNHTYAISDLSEAIETAFVAPMINKIDVVGQAPNSANRIVLLEDGKAPGDSMASIPFSSNAANKKVKFTLTDNSENLDGAVVSYIVEEVTEDSENPGTYVLMNPGDNGQEGPDEIEVITSDNGNTFEIDGDSGLYRIRIENRYKGTLCVGYTDVFAVDAR